MTHRIFVTCDIGEEALDRLRDRGFEVEVYPEVQPPPRSLVLEQVRSGVAALITTLRDRVDEEVFGAGAAAGLIGVLLTRGPDAVLAKGSTVEMVLDRNLDFDEGELDFSGAYTSGRRMSETGGGPLPSQKSSGGVGFPSRRF